MRKCNSYLGYLAIAVTWNTIYISDRALFEHRFCSKSFVHVHTTMMIVSLKQLNKDSEHRDSGVRGIGLDVLHELPPILGKRLRPLKLGHCN